MIYNFIYNPSLNTWSTASNSPWPRSDGNATKLADGRVLVHRGQGTQDLAIYSPTSDTWATITHNLPHSVPHITSMITLRDGSVLFCTVSDNYRGTVTGNTSSWITLPANVAYQPNSGDLAITPDGSIILSVGGSSSRMAKFNMSNNTWTALPQSIVSMSAHSMAVLPSGKLFVTRGENTDQVYKYG